jgi:DNA polymerase (family 10)
MDSRTAAHVLSQIGAYLRLRGESAFKYRAYARAARAVLAVGADDLQPLYASGALASVSGIGPATLSVIRDLIELGTSRYLEQLRESTPAGLLELLHVPGLSTERIHQFHTELGVDSLDALEAAAHDGRIASLPRLGPQTAKRILQGIHFFRRNGPLRLAHHVRAEAVLLTASLRELPGISRVEVAGSLRRRLDVVGDVDLVAAAHGDRAAILREVASRPGVTAAVQHPDRVDVTFVHGARLDLRVVAERDFVSAWWRNTGSAEHVDEVEARLSERGFSLKDRCLVDAAGDVVTVTAEHAIYAAAGLAYVEPELREGRGEVRAAATNSLPSLITDGDIQGALHCHTVYSDGKETIDGMVQAARARGWRYLGVSDHSRSAFYAGGLSPDEVLAQHEEIDALNARMTGFRVLKGIEADILADGQLDYDADLLDRFDYVIGSIHSRFSMDAATMTARVLRALDDPHLTILGHPTGRLLLSREGYALDVEAVLEKASRVGAAVELNADPSRMDLDWRLLQRAHELGVPVEIGPDAHSATGLDNVFMGIGMARKGWLTANDVLNTRDADAIVRFARARRATST